MNREAISKIINLVNSDEEVHYSDIALALNVSLSTAQRYAILFSKRFSNNVEYRRGKLIRKKRIGFDEIDLETRFKAIQQSLVTTQNRLEKAKEKLKKLVENDFNHHTKEELKKKIIAIIREMQAYE